MKILMVGNNSGGMYKFRIDLIRAMLEKYTVTVLSPRDVFVQETIDQGCGFIETPLDRRGINPIKDLRLFFLYRKILRSEKPDLVITYTIKPDVYCGLACRMKKLRYAANITGLGTAFEKAGFIRSLVTFLYKIALKRADTVFFENADNRDTFVAQKIVEEKKIKVLNGAGVDTEQFRYAEYPDGDTTKFIYIGRIMEEKGIRELTAAVQRLVNEGFRTELHIVGTFDGMREEEILPFCEEGWLYYHGLQEDVRPFLERSHCLVLPSWHEGMANTNLEAASMGRPVITSNIHGCLEAVEDGVSGFLCEKQNAGKLYMTMKQFISLPYEKRREMGLAGRQRMEKLFDRKIIVAETMRRLEI